MNETERTVGDRMRDKLHKLIHYTWKKNVKGIRLLGWHFYMSRRPMRLKTARAYDSTLRSEDRRAMFEALWERSGGRCELCGKQMDRETRKARKVTPGTAQCHHVIPLSMHVPGTEKDINNIQLLCMDCHRDLHANPVLYSAYITEALRARGLNPLDYFGDKQQLNKII